MLESSSSTTKRACDQCRVRKLRCDKTDSQDSPCTPCTQNGLNCTFTQKAVVRRSAPKWYVAGLETRVERLQALLTKLHPGVRFPELESQIEVGCWTTSDRPWMSVSATNSPKPPQDPTALEEQTMEQLLLTPYYGATNPYHIAQSAMRGRFKKDSDEVNDRDLFQQIFNQRRSDFWQPLPWEVRLQEAWKEARFTYPPPELATQLIDLYFDHSDALFPLLHRPTFVQNYQNKLHERDSEYGSVLLMVCAIGSRWMDGDPRVLDQRINISVPINNAYSAGWPFYEQVQQLPKLHSPSHTLEALQCYALSSIYLFGSSSLQVAYSILGFALRLAQQMGLHRRGSALSSDPSPRKRELWKRVFWVLVVLDRLLSSSLGRACALYDEEIDLDHPLPIEDDDWPLDPMMPLPSSSPSLTAGAYFSSMIRLTNIQVESLKRLNVGDPSQSAATSRPGLLNDMERLLVSFFDHLPNHLRWEPSRPDQDHIVLRQSAFIHAHYYSSFISGHRTNLPEPSSLLSCIKAGRACIDIIATANAIGEDNGGPWSSVLLLASASYVQFGIWSNIPELDDKAALASSITAALDELSQLEGKWAGAGKYRDILRALTAISHTETTETLRQPSGGPTGNILPVPPIEDFPSLEGTVTPGQDWRFLMSPVQNPLADRVDQYIAPSAGPSAGTEGDTQVDIWSPPTNAAEWEAWQQFMSRQRYSTG